MGKPKKIAPKSRAFYSAFKDQTEALRASIGTLSDADVIGLAMDAVKVDDAWEGGDPFNPLVFGRRNAIVARYHVVFPEIERRGIMATLRGEPFYTFLCWQADRNDTRALGDERDAATLH